MIADRHQEYRAGLAEVLAAAPELVVVGQAATAADLYRLASRESPDLILLDPDLPDGLAVAQAITALDPAIGLVIHTIRDGSEDYAAAEQAGACAYILKGTGARALVRQLRALKPAQLLYAMPQN